MPYKAAVSGENAKKQNKQAIQLYHCIDWLRRTHADLQETVLCSVFPLASLVTIPYQVSVVHGALNELFLEKGPK